MGERIRGAEQVDCRAAHPVNMRWAGAFVQPVLAMFVLDSAYADRSCE